MVIVNASTLSPTVEQGKDGHLNISENGVECFPSSAVFEQIIYTISALSCLCGLVGNIKVIWLLSFCIKRTPFTTYILNLAVADVGTLLSVLAYSINMAIFCIYEHVFIVWSLLDCLVFCTHGASLYLLTAISLERCLSVLFPIWHRCHRSSRSSAVISLLLWSLSVLLCGTLLFCELQMPSCGAVMNTICIVNFFICAPLMTACSLTVWVTVCRNSQRHPPGRLYVAILITLLVFIIFGVPLSLFHFIILNSDHISLPALEASYLLTSLNSSFNPLIYYLAGRDRKHQSRESLKVAFQRLFKDEADTRERN